MITMSKISKSFDDNMVLDGLCLHADRGEIFGLLGPSGAGKSTIINILTGTVDPCGGDHSVEASPDEIGLMLEEDGLSAQLTCLENLKIFGMIYQISDDRIKETLESVGLGEAMKKPVKDLSKGMRQRLALARAIMHKPRVIFLDEPTANLDPNNAREIHRLMKELRDAGSTIFLTSHNMEEVVKLCDRVAMLHNGQIIEGGEPIEICKRHDAVKTAYDLEEVFVKLTGEKCHA